jgi:hypothetical protein
MDCQDVSSLMSAYYDDELRADTRTVVEAHLQSCPRCLAELESFRHLSQVAAQWAGPSGQDAFLLPGKVAPRPAEIPNGLATSHSMSTRWGAALLLLSVVIVTAFFWRPRPHTHPAGEFDAFLETFHASPETSDDFLARMFHGQLVETTTAEMFLKYRPAIARGVPEGYSVSSAYVVKMPCCTCLQVNLKGENGRRLVLFEHDSLEKEWFEGRPTITAISQAGLTQLTQVEDALAASCGLERRRLTLVGARDLSEVDELLHFWTKEPIARSP